MTNLQPPSPADVEQIAKLIQQHLATPAAAGLPTAQAIGDDAKAAFCNNWGTVKPVLSALGGLLAAVPGVGVFAGPAIAVVTAAGDAASRAVCGK